MSRRPSTIPTFREYLLIEPARVHVEHRYRPADGEWSSVVKESIDNSVTLSSISVALPLARVYENVELSV